MAKPQHLPVEQSETVPAEEAENRPVFAPYVDIYEDEEGLTLVADMPGVSPDGVDAHVEKETLTIKGRVPEQKLDDGEVVYSEYQSGDYERAFTISHAVDASKIEATMADGVLTVRLPKAEQARERKIPVRPG